MHFQIRKKEKYLLFSMICYLLIVSSALFLIFMPVSAEYTLIDTQTRAGTGTSYFTAYGATKDFQFGFANWTTGVSDGMTWAHFTGLSTAYSSNPYCSWTGDINTEIYSSSAGGGNKCGDVHVIWDFGSHPNTNLVEGGTMDFYFSNLNSAGACNNAANYYVLGMLNTTSMNASSTCPTIRRQTSATPGYSPLEMRIHTQSTYLANMTYQLYSGSDTPDVPVINEVTSFPSCLEPGTGVVLESDVTGTVDDWTWEIYDVHDVSVWTGSTAVEAMIDPYVLSPGNYSVQLTVENSGGSDFWQQDDFLYINQSGTCNFTEYNPFPTISVTPTQNVYATMTMPPSVVVNISGVNEIIDNSYLGNMSAGYRSYVDQIGEGFNTTLVGVVSVVQSPLTMVVNGIAEGVSLFSVSVNSLMSYTTIPLAIVGITLSYYPWQIITLITAGIAIDAAFVLIFGVR